MAQYFVHPPSVNYSGILGMYSFWNLRRCWARPCDSQVVSHCNRLQWNRRIGLAKNTCNSWLEQLYTEKCKRMRQATQRQKSRPCLSLAPAPSLLLRLSCSYPALLLLLPSSCSCTWNCIEGWYWPEKKQCICPSPGLILPCSRLDTLLLRSFPTPSQI